MSFSFKNSLGFEITLVFIFIITFLLYAGGLLPAQFQDKILSVVGIIGFAPVALSAFRTLKDKKISVDLLAAIALFFTFVTAEWGSMLFINLMLSGARIIDVYTKRRVRLSLESLIKLKPSKARVLRGNESVEIPLTDVRVGDMVIVNLGEQIPVDGTVSEGEATINQASLTGESTPVLCDVGSTVLAATVVVSGNIVVLAKRVGRETTFEKMVDLVVASGEAKTKVKTLAEGFASWYIGIMLLVAIVIYLVTLDMRLVLAVVLVVCADDIAIAVPLAYIIAIGTAARRGIIVKSADFLDVIAKVTTLVVDKTGTLTLGKFIVTKVETFGEITDENVLGISGMLCARSNHPVSKAIVRYAKDNGHSCTPPPVFKEVEGRGIISKNANNQEIIIGRLEFLEESGVVISDDVRREFDKGVSGGSNITLLAVSGRVVAMFALTDEIRSGVSSSIKQLRDDDVREIIMLTGDNEVVAKSIADSIGIDKYYSKLLPEHKVFVLRDYLGKNNRVVAMVGDGVNDAAVLARSDVGIAMGSIGSGAAIESADIVLMQDDFEKIVEVREISKKVSQVVRGNFIIWGVVNIVGLYFVFIGTFGPTGAAAYNFLTDFIPIANSMRLFRYVKKTV